MNVSGETCLKGRWEAKHHGIGEFFEARLCPLGEGERSSASGPRNNNNKQKGPSQGDSADSKTSSSRRLREDVLVEPAAPEISGFRKTVSPPMRSSFLVEGTWRNEGSLPPTSSPIEDTSRDAQSQGPYISSDRIPIGGSSIGVDGSRIIDVRLTFEEAQRLYSVVSFGRSCWFYSFCSFYSLIEFLLHRLLTSSSLSCFIVSPVCEKPRMGRNPSGFFCDERKDVLAHLWYEASRSLNYESYLEEQLQKKTEDLERLWTKLVKLGVSAMS
ncbi:uncharacterized protein LOC107794771 [Nicotiana tabacum]|uniref:Uncharacterized protein LOC107794771 n=1 Tax=Nicotiana tabacum TaxID=4097 RepID=A0A1S4A867_TOBAC|nr:PREDICTED: uncharacterized protein LOC107794771 isoform X1 [Nicotiana tabacum]